MYYYIGYGGFNYIFEAFLKLVFVEVLIESPRKHAELKLPTTQPQKYSQNLDLI